MRFFEPDKHNIAYFMGHQTFDYKKLSATVFYAGKAGIPFVLKSQYLTEFIRVFLFLQNISGDLLDGTSFQNRCFRPIINTEHKFLDCVLIRNKQKSVITWNVL